MSIYDTNYKERLREDRLLSLKKREHETPFKYIKCCCTGLGNNLFINTHKQQETKVMSSYCRNLQLENSLGKRWGPPCWKSLRTGYTSVCQECYK